MNDEDAKTIEEIEEIKMILLALKKASMTLPEPDRTKALKRIKKVREYLERTEKLHQHVMELEANLSEFPTR